MTPEQKEQVGQAINDFMIQHSYDEGTECCLDWADSRNVDALVEVIDKALTYKPAIPERLVDIRYLR